MSDAKLSPHQQALLPYKYSIAETPLGNWIVTSPQMERPLCHFPDKQTAFSVAFTLNAEYGDVYDKGWERGYEVGYELAEKQLDDLDSYKDGVHKSTGEPAPSGMYGGSCDPSGYQPDGHDGPLDPPPGDE